MTPPAPTVEDVDNGPDTILYGGEHVDAPLKPSEDGQYRILSLGAGVQSTMVALASMLDPDWPSLSAAIFADTQWEPREVYEHLEWLKGVCQENGLPLIVVTHGDLRHDSLHHERGAAMPVFLQQTRQIPTGYVPCPTCRGQGVFPVPDAEWSGEGERPVIGCETCHQEGQVPSSWREVMEQGKIVGRACTGNYKVKPVRRIIQRMRRATAEATGEPAPHVLQVMGISLDEATRMRDTGVRYMTNEYPLVDRRISRLGCENWMKQRGFGAPRSACIGCPFHNDHEWRRIREVPEEWADAVRYDYEQREHRLTGGGTLRGVPFLHSSLVPLDQVDLSTPEDHGQGTLWENECEGMCGI